MLTANQNFHHHNTTIYDPSYQQFSSLPKSHALARMMLVQPGEVCEKPGSLLVLECMHDACMMDWQVMNELLQEVLYESIEAE